ncbi:hypothetical protein O7606_13930 [Micromonospora sp. WMMD882]|uniref:hypothetical protein n=1 Tax=Micromonospora sp. WMMD882 TaxID=3015151 RepID=UPI00248C8B92|nr:hypothetical protein [Micromonospora sp. WMMD882]WBB77393.1 hypothetical protein O7606_13930 [Micromonospora sp. WMMD882]
MDAFGRSDLRGEVNPYPSSAVAQIADAGSTSFTIPTVAVRRANNTMDAYLAAVRADPRRASGQVLAIVGEYGTGKTHLAAHLIRHAGTTLDGALQSVHLNAPPDTFVSLYLAFAEKLDQRREIVHEQVRSLYAEIVAEDLRSSAATAPLADSLRAGALDPVALVEGFGLMETEFLRRLQEHLREITDNVGFSRALTLLLRGGFEAAVWEWFSGRPPSEVLRERGITWSITGSETTALQAMGVFALLIGHGAHPFVMVIDELDQLLTAAGRPDEAIDAFKEMLRVFAASNTFLILAGLPDLLTSMRKDVRDRISEQITMTGLTSAEVQDYIVARQRGHLEPFTEQTVAHLVDLTNGVPRAVISLCHRLWRHARDHHTVVTTDLVRRMAREYYNDNTGIQNVRAEIRQVLVDAGYDTYIPEHFLDAGSDSRVDYWVPVGPEDAGCAVILAEPLLDETDIAAVERRAQSIRAHRDCELLLVVLEPPPARFRQRLREAVGREPITYHRRAFLDQFALEFKAVATRLADRYPLEGSVALVTPHLMRLARRQTTTQQMLTMLVESVDELRGRSDQRLAAIHRELHEIQREVSTSVGEQQGGHLAVVAALPQAVIDLFDAAFTQVDLLTPTGELLRQAFQEDDAGRHAQQSVRARIPSAEIHQAIGVTTLLVSLIEAYGYTLAEWYRSVTQVPTARLTVRHRERLETVCNVFDAVFDYLPLYQLRRLRELVGATGPGRQQREAEDLLRDFTNRVRHELLTALAPLQT